MITLAHPKHRKKEEKHTKFGKKRFRNRFSKRRQIQTCLC